MAEFQENGPSLRPIAEIAASAGIPPEALIPHGHFAAKIDLRLMEGLAGGQDGKLILVTAMSPTPAGEGKTTLTIGLAQSLKLIGKKVMASIRQPSLGPLLGAKGGATGSGLSMVRPAEDISLQFTGDDYAVLAAHNLVSSMIDNHVYHGNRLGIEKITWKRVSAINDRALRRVRVGLAKDGPGREEEFHITAASEIMSILCLSTGLTDLRARIKRTLVGYDRQGAPVTVAGIKADGAAAALLKNALNPNLVQSAEGAPVFVHGGPFGNISIGCSSIASISLALKLSDYVLTEAGFSTELGAEKFFDIVCRTGGFTPSAAVIVATLNALRLHGGASDYRRSDMAAVRRGMGNLKKHIENIASFGVPAIVAINRFGSDAEDDLDETVSLISALGTRAVIVDVREQGGAGGIEAARMIVDACALKSAPEPIYALGISIKDKIGAIASKMYGARAVSYTGEALRDIEQAEAQGLRALPVCIAKTPKSISDNPELLGRPEGFDITVRGLRPATGAGYLVALCGSVMLMPGLPEHPLAEGLDVDPSGRITGI